MLRAWRRRSTLREAGSRKQWLATIVRNEAFRHYSRPRPDPTDEVEQLRGARGRARSSRPSTGPTCRRRWKRLSERERVLLSLRYEEDLTQPAIAARLGIPEGTVKVQLHRARLKLRRAYVP